MTEVLAGKQIGEPFGTSPENLQCHYVNVKEARGPDLGVVRTIADVKSLEAPTVGGIDIILAYVRQSSD